ncbi:MAG: carbohydrate ABC transporter substrate-binding protein, partial [Terriglobia bacterium]
KFAVLKRSGEFRVSERVGVEALNMLRELMDGCPRQCLDWNPIAIHDVMSSSDEFAYCPFAYAYSNYARPGYGRRRLEFGDLPSFEGTGRAATTLGGAGLAISAQTQHQQEAADYARYVASADCQRGLYFWSGGQPGHRQAWVDEEVNGASCDFFRKTLPALDRAYLRPRYEGYSDFQERASRVTRDFLVNRGDARRAMGKMRAIFEKTRPASSIHGDESYETP